MRVRPERQTETRRRPAAVRRLRAGRPAHPDATAPDEPQGGGEDASPHPEHRYRDAGGPEDMAVYSCGCGFVFEHAVSTSVACPHCGSGQAW
jgi:hypothetical protein